MSESLRTRQADDVSLVWKLAILRTKRSWCFGLSLKAMKDQYSSSSRFFTGRRNFLLLTGGSVFLQAFSWLDESPILRRAIYSTQSTESIIKIIQNTLKDTPRTVLSEHPSTFPHHHSPVQLTHKMNRHTWIVSFNWYNNLARLFLFLF